MPIPMYLVSAFYGECVSRRMSVCGSIYTKSKFLGLSIAVDMVGNATISLLDHGEHYTFNFPTAYGR